jgi:hypothetical protein
VHRIDERTESLSLKFPAVVFSMPIKIRPSLLSLRSGEALKLQEHLIPFENCLHKFGETTPKRVKIVRTSSVFFFEVRWCSVLLGTSEFMTPELHPLFCWHAAKQASCHILGIDSGRWARFKFVLRGLHLPLDTHSIQAASTR